MENFVQDANAQPQWESAPPSNYLLWAILSTLFCCLPLGIVSIIKSTSVNSKWQAGDYAGARKASEQAKKWAIISAIVQAVLFIIMVTTYYTSSEQ